MGLDDVFIDVSTLPAGGYGFCQLLFLFGVYGYILMNASNMISDGSEFLLLVPAYAGIVGSVVLPILGAVPDGMLILFSGMGDDAQNQLAVGVGALAGSTIMLLTIPWFLSILGGRVDLDSQGRPNYRKSPKLAPDNLWSFQTSGIALAGSVRSGAWMMLGTSTTYLLLQGPGLYYSGLSLSEVAWKESNWALVGMVVCFALFVAYLWYQIQNSASEELGGQQDRRNSVIEEALRKGEVTLLGVMQTEFNREELRQHLSESSPLVLERNPQLHNRLKAILKPFFAKYDANGDGNLTLAELANVFRDLGEYLTTLQLVKIFSDFDQDRNGNVDFNEFVCGVVRYINSHQQILEGTKQKGLELLRMGSADLEAGDGDEENPEDEEEEMPEDLAHLSPEEQQHRLKMRAAYYLIIGTGLVILFSDPMVNVLSEIGTRTGAGAFSVSFVLAPLASNASELIAAYKYSLKKTTSSIAISISTLQGAACMNNTFGLGIFMALIYSQSLAWQYLAETLSILFVQICLFVLVITRRTHTVLDACIILSLYPLSLVFVAVLESLGWD